MKISTRATLLKQKRQKETKRREEASQKKKTQWLKWCVQKQEDRKTERAQFLAMRRKKEASRMYPSLLSPVHRIQFNPSPTAQKILGLNPASPELSFPSTSDPTDIPFPILSSSIKEEVLKNTVKKIFPPKKTSPLVSKPATQPQEEPVSKDFGCSSKEADGPKPNSPQNVFSGGFISMEGSAANISLLTQEKKQDSSLC